MQVCDEGIRNLACGVCAKAVEDYSGGLDGNKVLAEVNRRMRKHETQ